MFCSFREGFLLMLVALLLAYETIYDTESSGELKASLTLLMGIVGWVTVGTVGKRVVERAFKISNSASSC